MGYNIVRGKLNCSKGISCGGACVSSSKKCRKALPGKWGAVLEQASGRLNQEPDYSSWNKLAEGYQGEVRISPDGKRVVKIMKDESSEFGDEEIQVATRMGELGHSPRIISSSPKHLEMELAKGKPLWKSFGKEEGEAIMNATQARKAAYALRDLHRIGYAHGDAHSQQFLVDNNNVKLVDFGLIVKTSVQPNRVLQDLSKIAKLIGWDNPELSTDPYFQIVNKYLEEYKKITKSTSKANKAKKVRLAEEYLQEIQNLK